jgi:hypothetical protein
MRAISAIAKSHHVVKMIYCSTEAEIATLRQAAPF